MPFSVTQTPFQGCRRDTGGQRSPIFLWENCKGTWISCLSHLWFWMSFGCAWRDCKVREWCPYQWPLCSTTSIIRGWCLWHKKSLHHTMFFLRTQLPFSWQLSASGHRNLISCWELEAEWCSFSCPCSLQLSVPNTMSSSTSPFAGRVLVQALHSPFQSVPCTLALVMSSVSTSWMIWIHCQKLSRKKTDSYPPFIFSASTSYASPVCVCPWRDHSNNRFIES